MSDYLNENLPLLPKSPEIEDFRLKNGMQVILCRMPGLHRISVLLNVKAGCRDERLPGTAHMLEHLIFRGSKKHPSLRELSEAFEAYGADFNAYTAREVTSFDVLMPVESFEPVMHLLGSTMSHPKLTGIAAERDIIREEIISDYDGDGTLINVEDLLVSLFYGESGRPIAGDPCDLEKLSKQEIQAFYQAHYCASNMFLVIAGPLDNRCKVEDLLEDAFSDLPSVSSSWRRRAIPDIYRRALKGGQSPDPRLVVRKYDGATQSDIILGFLCHEASHREFSVLEMLVRVLDDGMASRLSRRLVEELALVYDAEAYLSTTQESTLLQIRVSCRHRRVSRLVEAVYQLLKEIAENSVPDEELQRLRRRVIWEHLGLLDGVASFCQWVSTMTLQALPDDIEKRCHRLLSVDADSIRKMAAQLLSERPHIVTVVGDLGEKAAQELQSSMSRILNKKVDLTVM